MVTVRHGVVQIIKRCLFLCQINFKLKLLGYQPTIPTCITQVGYLKIASIRHGAVKINKTCLFLCQINFKQKLLWYQPTVPTCITQVGYLQIASIRHGVVKIIKEMPPSLPNQQEIFVKLKT